jgi:hypothetical protein
MFYKLLSSQLYHPVFQKKIPFQPIEKQEPHLKSGLKVGAPEGKAIPAPLVVNQSLVVSQSQQLKMNANPTKTGHELGCFRRKSVTTPLEAHNLLLTLHQQFSHFKR